MTLTMMTMIEAFLVIKRPSDVHILLGRTLPYESRIIAYPRVGSFGSTGNLSCLKAS